MSNALNIPTTIQWPDGIDEHVFLNEYWQKKPLLLRQAFPGFDTPLPADELAGLSLEEDTTPRLITRNTDGHYELEHGPFNEDRFSTLGASDWSLLVTDVEKHIPELSAYLTPFSFLPSWRIDDLMISYAPVGASVGAHIDEYDVFLLQASGNRRWSIDSQSDQPRNFVEDSTLKLIESFNATDSWELEPGDMLYLPPGVGHHGVASAEPCTTWSIGFRAPAISDVVIRLSELITEELPPARYTDGKLRTAVPGEITQDALDRFRQLWQDTISVDDSQFASLVARMITESGVAENIPEEELANNSSAPELTLYKAPFTQMAWYGASSKKPDEPVSLFVNGDLFYCSQALAIALCGNYPVTLPDGLNNADSALISQLQELGCLLSA